MTRISAYYNMGKGEDSSVPQNESVYDNAFRSISAQVKEEDRRKEAIEREESKKMHNMIMSHMYEENRRNGDYSSVLTAIQYNENKEEGNNTQSAQNNMQSLIANHVGTNLTGDY